MNDSLAEVVAVQREALRRSAVAGATAVPMAKEREYLY